MSDLATRVRRAMLALAVALGLAQPAFASPPDCTCQNLTSLQQDYQNAVRLERFFRDMYTEVKAVEDRIIKAKQTPGDVDEGADLGEWSRNAAQLFREQNLSKIGLTGVDGYTGPSSVEMEYPKCTQKQAELDAMEAGSPCKAIADAALEHEAKHRNKCTDMGAEAYWNRLQSEVALEEAAHYEAQAAKLRDELRWVLEASEITYEVDWSLDISVQGMAEYGYSYTARSDDIGNATDGDTWTMNGEGQSTVAWTKAVIAGMTCTPTGAVTTTFNTKMTTDGLTFDLEVEELSSSGALGISCPGGGGGGPVGEGGGGGQIAADVPLNAGDNVLPGDMGSEIRAIMAGMGTVSGDGKRVLSVTCNAP